MSHLPIDACVTLLANGFYWLIFTDYCILLLFIPGSISSVWMCTGLMIEVGVVFQQVTVNIFFINLHLFTCTAYPSKPKICGCPL